MLEKIFRVWNIIVSSFLLIVVAAVVVTAWYELGTSIRYSRISTLLEKVYLGEDLSQSSLNMGDNINLNFSYADAPPDTQLDYIAINSFLFYALPILKLILLTISISGTRLLGKKLADQFDVSFLKYIFTVLYPKNLQPKYQAWSGRHLLFFWLSSSSIILIVASWL